MAENIKDLVILCLQSNGNQRLTARNIGEWIFKNHRAFCEEKRNRSKQDLSNDADLLEQIIAEIGADRPAIERRNRNVKTTETRPRLYYYSTESDAAEVLESEGVTRDPESQPVITSTGSSLEVDLYPKLASYLHTQLNVFPKRIDEKKSLNKLGPNGNKWLYPDLVGMEDFGAEWDPELRLCVKHYGDRRINLWSFEVKRLLNRSNVREAWFQAVSNSSWANFGYLVAPEIATNCMKELRMLAAAHGIGVIRLNKADPSESEILIPAKERPEVDWDSANRLIEENRDFRHFVELVKEFHQTDKAKRSDWDIPSS
ncbi:HrgA protein [Oxalobacteraceae bacterium OM1]|nr:HrgA protein [Oxalobacteraceae bacterium OM1]